MYKIIRERDEVGDSGNMSTALWIEGDEVKYEHNARPRVGVALRVGSLIARSYSYQDYWQTSIITEILEDTENRVRFRTGNSVYEWTCA